MLIQEPVASKYLGIIRMDKPSRDSYGPSNFLEWREAECLELSPKFQRRSVWKLPQRSYLIDTLLRQMPVPPIYLRNIYDTKRNKVIREVIDGQQRLGAILDYIDDKYALSRTVRAVYAGKRYSALSNAEQTAILKYRFICETFDDISDREVLEVFQRLNMVSVRLSKQELRNGRFFGPFKQSCYDLAYDHLELWRKSKIFTETKISRMLEVQLTSELLIAQIAGMQDKKDTIDSFYADNDIQFQNKELHERHFRATVDQITETFDGALVETEFRRQPFFYTLFCVIYHRTFGLPNEDGTATPKKKLTVTERDSLKEAVSNLSQTIAFARAAQAYPKKFTRFVAACQRSTDNIQERRTRFTTLYTEAFK